MPPPRAARVLIVDDSAVMRSLLRSVVLTDKRLEVAGTAIDGASALRAVDTLHPDLVLLDVEMPIMDGLSTLKQMKAKGLHVPVIMCSSLTQRGAKVTIEALASGAADYVAKPMGQASRESAIQNLANDVVPKILALTASRTIGFHTLASTYSEAPSRNVFPGGRQPAQPTIRLNISEPVTPAQPLPGRATAIPSIASPRSLPATFPGKVKQYSPPPILTVPPSVVCIGVSTGGPAALDVVLPEIPANFSLPILIVQHMPELFTKMLAERLDSRCPLRVVEATPNEPIHPGTIYIAKGNWHMEVAQAAHGVPTLRLNQDEPENHCRPAVDVLFRTAVSVYGGKILGVILTGMGADGLAGCRLIREHNGTVLAQDQATSTVWGMPGAVAQAGLAHRILPLNAIAPEILRLTGRGQREAFELRESAV